jgi:hypothetical protein
VRVRIVNETDNPLCARFFADGVERFDVMAYSYEWKPDEYPKLTLTVAVQSIEIEDNGALTVIPFGPQPTNKPKVLEVPQ